MPKDFHDTCNGKGPTLVLIRSEPGKICGGYTKVPWSDNGHWKEDSSAFVFSVDSKYMYPCLKPKQAVYHSNDRGPCFGGDLLNT